MRYSQGKFDRDPYLRRARDNSALTIPYLFRPEGDNSTTDPEVPWNSGGAYALASMAAKLILALFPVGQPPMKLKPGQATQESIIEMAADDPDQAGSLEASIDLGLSRVEGEFVECVEEDGDRAKLAIGALKLLAGGNHGFAFQEKGVLRGISLDRYVTWRDASGNLLEFVVEDGLAYESLPPDIKGHVDLGGYKQAGPNERHTALALFTHGYLQDGRWQVYQEIYGKEVEGSRYFREPEALDFFFPVWNLLDGEHYGRSYVENYLGDLQGIEGIAMTVQQGAAAIAKFLTLVDPTGLTSKKTLAQAANGAIITGRKDDVHVLESGKGGDLQAVMAISDKMERRIAAAFLMNSSVQRQGERVTAEEIRFVAGELEDAQAGAYSQQAITWQQPYVRLKLAHLMKARRVTPLPAGSVKVTILGGMGGLARNAELQALDTLVDGAMQKFGPSAAERINLTIYYHRRAAALGVKVDGLLYSQEYLDRQKQEAQQMALAQSMGPEAIKQVGQNITSNEVADTQAASRQAQLPAPAEA